VAIAREFGNVSAQTLATRLARVNSINQDEIYVAWVSAFELLIRSTTLRGTRKADGPRGGLRT